ncbi:hypothetical protein L202_03897 [Cryptococcus amylolentus CBS 6039]|uniref:Uncharacterized protein n=2 Tax=Cryptococcus amylolentus TaxID=104669 RepID=A0A1E3HV45_9TREE|nr:hypothetical protein L202_03897 [Cryptococcus amylolentus CBS 6039]ODN80035.1 hypothetical protein L202_03897 [Cryptococcus amylolentus CBS 6039]ODO08265.1 hypothetical protein I350_03855 [Cryptococcus amylolentus CBS 6273]
MSYPEEAPTAATYPQPSWYDQDDEALLTHLDLQVDPKLTTYWDELTTEELRKMPDDELEWTRGQWQIFTRADGLNNTTLEIDSGLRAFLENSNGELIEASAASATGSLEQSVSR